MKLSVAFRSSWERGYTLPTFGTNVSFMFISWLYGQEGGRSLAIGSSNTFLKAEYSGGNMTSSGFWAAASSRAWDNQAMVEAWRNLDPHRTIRPMA